MADDPDSNFKSMMLYNYSLDYVLAVTAEAIGIETTKILENIPDDAPVITYCYLRTSKGDEYVDLATLQQRLKGSAIDPFALSFRPGTKLENDNNIKVLQNAGFVCAYKAAVGFSPGLRKKYATYTVAADKDTTASNISFVYKCPLSTFVMVELGKGSKGELTWTSWDQEPEDSDDPSPWVWTYRVRVSINTIDPKNTAAYQTLPEYTRKRFDKVKSKLGVDGFKIDAFELGFANMTPISKPDAFNQISDDYRVKRLVGETLPKLKNRWLELNVQHKALIASLAIATKTPTKPELQLTGYQQGLQPFLADGKPLADPTEDQLQLTVFNLQCMADGNAVHAPVQTFPWNWIPSSGSGHGCITIGRSQLLLYLRNELDAVVKGNCFKPKVSVTTGVFGPDYGVSWDSSQAWSQYSWFKDGALALRYIYNPPAAYDETWDTLSHMSVSIFYQLDVWLFGSTIQVKQTQSVYLNVQKVRYLGPLPTADFAQGHIIDRSRTENYDLAVSSAAGSEGELIVNRNMAQDVDNPSTMGDRNKFVDFLSGMSDIIKNVTDTLPQTLKTNLAVIPSVFADSYAIPAGGRFGYSNVRFPSHGDLVANLRYNV